MKPVKNEDIFKDSEPDSNSIKKYVLKNWKNILVFILSLYTILSIILGINGYSWAVAIKSGDAKVQIELNDICFDSSVYDMELFDVATFKPKKPLFVAVHCTASKEGNNLTKADLIRIFKEKGFRRPGYHYAIDINGKVIELIPLNKNDVIDYAEIAQGVRNNNSTVLSVCYIGGLNKKMKSKDTRTSAQKLALVRLLVDLKIQFPTISIKGHRDFKGIHKECPSFSAIPEYSWIK